MRGHTEDMLDHISTLARHLSGFRSQYVVLVMLMDLEINEKHDGFEYLRTAIELFHEDPAQMITKGLYPVVAKRCGRCVGGKAVERAIRTAIKSAWEKHGEMWMVYFPSSERPSNGDFIARLSKYLSLWEECCKAYERQTIKEDFQNER